METQFPLRDGRGYVQWSDIGAYVLRRFGALAPNRIVIDFLKPTSTHVDLVLRDKEAGPAAHAAVFTVKVIHADALQIYEALPLTGEPIVQRIDSSHFVACEKYSSQALEVTSTAHAAADFFYDLSTCMKNHWRDYNYENRALLVRRMELRWPFAVPASVSVHGKFKKLKLGAQAWHFTAPTLPEFEFSVVGLYQASSIVQK